MNEPIQKAAKATKTSTGLKKGASSRQLLIETAAVFFAKDGFAKSNMRQLAESVGMKAGSIFYHFKSKDEILFEVMKQAIEHLLITIEADYKPEQPALDRLRIMVKSELGMYISDMSNFGVVLIHEWRNLDPEFQTRLLDMRDNYERYWLTTLTDCQNEGIIKADPKIVRRLLNGAFSWVIFWYKSDGEYSFDELVDQVMLTLVVGE